jgi:hypothetical protein
MNAMALLAFLGITNWLAPESLHIDAGLGMFWALRSAGCPGRMRDRPPSGPLLT